MASRSSAARRGRPGLVLLHRRPAGRGAAGLHPAYASVDLDPSGGQKIEAIETLNKFPAFKDEIGLDTDDDIRKKMFDEINSARQCEGLNYADDIEPWLGDRAAVAAVDPGGEEPDVAFVRPGQGRRRGRGRTGEDRASATARGRRGRAAGSIEGDWAVIAETEKIAAGIVDDAAEAPLATTRTTRSGPTRSVTPAW